MFKFQLPDGRAIELVSLTLEQTYSGVLEGSREDASAYIRKEVYERAARMLPPARPLAVIDNYQPELPRWVCVGLFRSYGGVRTDDEDAGSRLYVCWFMEDTAKSLGDSIWQILPKIYWNKFAEDYDMFWF